MLTGARATPRVPGHFRLAEGWGGLALAPLYVLRHQTVIRGAHRATQGPWNVAGKATTLTLGWGPRGSFQEGSGLFTSLGSVPLGEGVGVLSIPFTHRSQALPRHQSPGPTLPRWSPMVTCSPCAPLGGSKRPLPALPPADPASGSRLSLFRSGRGPRRAERGPRELRVLEPGCATGSRALKTAVSPARSVSRTSAEAAAPRSR